MFEINAVENNLKSVAFYTLGCKLNFSETSTIARNLKENGYHEVNFDDKSDVYVINTCSVTNNADKECRQIVKKARQTNPDGFIVVVGCYAQLKPHEIAALDGVDLVLGAKEKFNIAHFLKALKKSEEAVVHSCEIEEADFYESAYSIGDRTRAFLKVQDGCDYKCTYCTIPLARGISRSDSIENILQKADEIASQGIKEIVLTGVNIGDYGKGEFGNKKHDNTFLELVERLDKETKVERLRISSIEPNLLKNELIEYTLNSQRFVPHFHVPLQSGCDELLKKMKRRYLTALYRERVAKIKEIMPDACIGVDVIVGFPGETEENFMETYHFLNELPVSYFHVFTYSERDDTPAATMENPVPIKLRKKRNKMLRILSEKKKMEFYRSQLDTEHVVLWESENKNGKIEGYTENYVRVQTNFDEKLINQKMDVNLAYIDNNGVVEVQILERV
ncbi:(Dimethylallyl)adenosine tRNA methylthiotransferase MiaB [Candidatus Ornithobacterium hominis]|uniref:Threonylcarbamoyladenosine tRNA methylthiotransferase MtaB n=1 Tax=Candidatus Ornithobacterium hominis TaxID=2497989 RepID=A0A383U3L2_9FLAO|nr:tRNA (N(6)-L-threonylcarbamoyladenosine(37)-C(2))-methylthiotransferase MtaB [Candidatus Ornithobacterium hominis]MCT7905033.1 tRNA (N(6)-L-threonylcarbamoyladenosine(37)-C(2))-methylthiotransferase MtaB [Candidatus Ornithobacterium hominis]SZD74130.1 (Dimethylallyl)adenosine tRNA methylthiotransferase MiaB [Candidatus Ornithobacterium hominis]